MDLKELNNKIILLRKSLKSIVNQTKINLAKKVKKDKELKKNVARKESELECFKRIKPTDIPLSIGLYPDQLNKTVTSVNSVEIDRVIARILQNSLVQKTLVSLKEKFGIEKVDAFLKNNEKQVKKTEAKRIENEVNNEPTAVKKRKIDDKSDGEEKKVEKKKSKKQKVKDDDDEDKVSSKTADPFFVNSTGESYLASIKDLVSEESEEDEDEKLQKRKVSNKRTSDARFTNLKRNEQSTQPKIDKPIIQKQAEEEKLHPSWLAKQQLRKTIKIQEFQGTKIKFNDDD